MVRKLPTAPDAACELETNGQDRCFVVTNACETKMNRDCRRAADVTARSRASSSQKGAIGASLPERWTLCTRESKGGCRVESACGGAASPPPSRRGLCIRLYLNADRTGGQWEWEKYREPLPGARPPRSARDILGFVGQRCPQLPSFAASLRFLRDSAPIFATASFPLPFP